MPLYEYRCSNCGDRIEVIQRVSDPPYDSCQKCGGAMKKVVSAPAIQFKGSGFYKTDYAGKKESGGESKPAEKKSESTSDGSASGGTKPAD